MTETKACGFSWWLPIWGALGAVVLCLPMMISGNDIGAFLATVLLAALIGLILIAVAISKVRRYGLEVLAMVCIFFVFAWSLWRSHDYLRTTARWFVHSQSYKTQVLNQSIPLDGSLKHIEWDGWGFAGSGDTVVYLAFDPSDRLASAAKSHSSGTFSGIPCRVVGVHRLEHNWYTVLFYTDNDWSHCG